jgi:signal transduction histidine kinase
MIAALPAAPADSIRRILARGLRVSWPILVLLAAINTGMALLLWVEDPRPFWHPFVTVQIYGFCIAYCVNAASPWETANPITRLCVAVAIGTLLGLVLSILAKGYALDDVIGHWQNFCLNVISGFANGMLVSLFFLVKFREQRAATALHRAEAERHLLSKQTVEAELKMMQAQVEPHFLFNTLASVHYLTETDPREANRLLGHLIEYLRAALPQLRASSTTLGKEGRLVSAYLNILQMRLGARMGFTLDLPPELADHPLPPNMLLCLVENAVKHGIEPAAEGGTIAIAARAVAGDLVVTVTDSGRGPAAAAPGGQGVGLANIRERLATLYGGRGAFDLESLPQGGTRATLTVPTTSGA